jgi:phage/plasmid primase-like uncharacterized protein
MPDREKMQRVSRKTPCPVCGKPDWCLIAPDKTVAICQRIQEGSVRRCGDAGWLHILIKKGAKFQRPNKYSSRIPIDFGKEKDFSRFAMVCKHQLSKEKLQQLTKQLNISAESLTKLNIGWDGRAYTFPMSDTRGRIIGIRRRFPNGHKVSVRDSRTGLFIPSQRTVSEPVLVCEGTTDTAAAIDLGFNTIGRPNCNSLIKMTALAVKNYEEIVIVADNDTAGKTGAEKLADYLAVRCQKVKIICPPEWIKDLRQWLGKGLTQTHLKRIIERSETVMVQIKTKD